MTTALMTISSIDDPEAIAHERFLRDTDEIGPATALVPEGYCRDVLAEPLLTPCGLQAGNRFAARLVGAYPARQVNDPKAYALAIGLTFAQYAEEIGEAALTHLLRSLKFLPSAADVEEACQGITTELNRRRIRARRMVAEHERRAEEVRERQRIERDRPAVAEGMAQLAGRLRTKASADREAFDGPGARPRRHHGRSMTLAERNDVLTKMGQEPMERFGAERVESKGDE